MLAKRGQRRGGGLHSPRETPMSDVAASLTAAQAPQRRLRLGDRPVKRDTLPMDEARASRARPAPHARPSLKVAVAGDRCHTAARAALTWLFRERMKQGCELLGFSVPARM